MTISTNPAARHHYRSHPMGYACLDCGRAAQIGERVHHSGLCDIAPKQAVLPVWADDEEIVEAEAAVAAGLPGAENAMAKALGVTEGHNPAEGRWSKRDGQWVVVVGRPVSVGEMILARRSSGELSEQVVAEVLATTESGGCTVSVVSDGWRPSREDKKAARAFSRMRYR